MASRPVEVVSALEQLSVACGELSARRRKGNFFRGTLAKIDAQDDAICDSIAVIIDHMEDLEAENEHLRQELSGKSEEHPHGGTLHMLSECTGECAAELAGKKTLSELREMAEKHELPFNDEDVIEESEYILAKKGAGQECSVCAHGDHQ